MVTKIRASLRRAVAHIWWSPTFYMMRLAVRLNSNHPMRDIVDIHRWRTCATPLLQHINHIMWALIVIEVVAIWASIAYYPYNI